MKVWENHSYQEILQSLEVELAKAQSEMRCAEADISKAKNRIAFIITAIHHLKNKGIEE